MSSDDQCEVVRACRRRLLREEGRIIYRRLGMANVAIDGALAD